MTGQQLAMFEPTGPEVLALAQKHEKDAARFRSAAEIMDLRGWLAIAEGLLRQAGRSQRIADEMYMLAEFEALGGVV